MSKSDAAVYIFMTAAIVAGLGVTTWHFFLQKNYQIVIETTCDPSIEICFSRDCSEPDSCPPNGYTDYRVFTMTAGDYDACKEESCIDECANGTADCEETVCGESPGDVCSVYEKPTSEEVPATLSPSSY